MDQLCVELREQLMNQHKNFMTKQIMGPTEGGAEASSATGSLSALVQLKDFVLITY
jgi:hypothetical protein